MCYGFHHLFNILTNIKDVPDAILVRSIYPIEALRRIRRKRVAKLYDDSLLCVGPSNLSKAIGITIKESGVMLNKNKIHIREKSLLNDQSLVQSWPRIGLGYAGKDALLHYRFYVNHRHLEKTDFASG